MAAALHVQAYVFDRLWQMKAWECEDKTYIYSDKVRFIRPENRDENFLLSLKIQMNNYLNEIFTNHQQSLSVS